MDPPMYDGNIHPNRWLKQVQVYCSLKKIGKDEILEFAKMMIDSEINIPESITCLDELVNVLKQDISFSIFKNTNQRKLQSLKYLPEEKGGETSKFVSDFRKFCCDAEINDIEVQKHYLCKSLPKDYIFDEFHEKMKNVNSTNELIKEFEETIVYNSNLIKNGSVVALKHIATGKYLSSIKNSNYKSGSYSQLVLFFIYIKLHLCIMLY